MSPHCHTAKLRKEASGRTLAPVGSCVGTDSCLNLRGHVAGKQGLRVRCSEQRRSSPR